MSASARPSKQQACALSMVWLTWLGLPALAVLMAYTAGWVASAIVLVVGIMAQAVYVRQFPHFSSLLGYGSVTDVPTNAGLGEATPLKVTLFTANVCPFCPLVRKRLRELQARMHFELAEVDVTFQPQIVVAKGLRSVPVVEVNGRVFVGNATSAELAGFLAAAGSIQDGVRLATVESTQRH